MPKILVPGSKGKWDEKKSQGNLGATLAFRFTIMLDRLATRLSLNLPGFFVDFCVAIHNLASSFPFAVRKLDAFSGQRMFAIMDS